MCNLLPVHHEYHAVTQGDLGIHLASVTFTTTPLSHLYSRCGNQGPNEEQRPGDVKLLAQAQGPGKWRRQSVTGVLVHKTCSPSTFGSWFPLDT